MGLKRYCSAILYELQSLMFSIVTLSDRSGEAVQSISPHSLCSGHALASSSLTQTGVCGCGVLMLIGDKNKAAGL